MGMFVFNYMVNMSGDRASQWTVDRSTAITKEVSPVGSGIGWHFMVGLVWTREGAQMRRSRTRLERVGVPAGDLGKNVAIVRETDQRLVLEHPGKFEFEEICNQKLVHRKATGGGVNLVQPVNVGTATEDPRMFGVDMVQVEDAVENPMVRVVRDSVTQVQPVDVETATEDPMVDVVEVVRS